MATMIYAKPLKVMPYANAYVKKYDDGKIVLVSYTTEVIRIDADGWIECTGLYSATTRRHISRFMDEYTDRDYYFAKKLYTDGIKFNLNTGEVKEVVK